MTRMCWQRNGSVGVLVGLAVALVLGGCGRDTLLGGDRTITDFRELATPAGGDRQKLVGKKVKLDNVVATKELADYGDYVFWVGDGKDDLPVVLESELAGTAAENAVTIRPNRHYDVSGTVRLVENIPKDSRIWRLLRPAKVEQVRRAVIYVGADKVTER